jgi:hypothetical protein
MVCCIVSGFLSFVAVVVSVEAAEVVQVFVAILQFLPAVSLLL